MIIELHAHWIRANQGFFGCGEDWRVEKWLSQSVSSKFAVYTSELTLRFLASSNPEAVRRSSSRGSSLRPGPERPRSLFHAKHDPQFPPGRNFFPSFPSFFRLSASTCHPEASTRTNISMMYSTQSLTGGGGKLLTMEDHGERKVG